MFRKLRIKFIAITMVMVTVVMALAFTAVCISEYQRSLSVVQTTLDDAVIEASNFKEGNPPNGPGYSGEYDPEGESSGSASSASASMHQGRGQDSGGSSSSSSGMRPDADFKNGVPEDFAMSNDEGNGATRPNIGGRQGQHRGFSSLIPIAVYIVKSEGTVAMVGKATSADISSDLLAEATGLALNIDDGFGTFSDIGLHYKKQTQSDGSAILAFADTSYTDGWKSLALILAIAGLCTLVVFFVISLFFSKWALKPVREAWNSQRQFVADASHDLKTPLTVILANASILLKHPERTIASESQWIESTQVEAENMQGLVNEMLELAQVESGQQAQVPLEPVDFSDLVDGSTLLFDSVALERNCFFDCSIDEDITVIGNMQRLQKMVSTIVDNAFKYVDEGGNVSVSLRRDGNTTVLKVHNTGQQISPEDLPHIFDRFYRTDKARTSGAGGFGLGLAIAREIARSHNGDITCTSNGSGTTFTVTLPVA